MRRFLRQAAEAMVFAYEAVKTIWACLRWPR